jgi:penicillin-binding protein 1A
MRNRFALLEAFPITTFSAVSSEGLRGCGGPVTTHSSWPLENETRDMAKSTFGERAARSRERPALSDWRRERRKTKVGKTTRQSGPHRPLRLPRWMRTVAKWAAVATIWIAVIVGGLIAWYGSDMPDIDRAIAATRRPAITVLAVDGRELATSGDLFGSPVDVSSVPPALPLAVLATEDRRFYDHFGVDPVGLLRAVIVNIRAGSIVQGGSTITQQVAKNLFLTPQRTLKRKVQELLLAFWIERKFTKDEILSLYLNRAYFGAGAYGVDAAARKFFGTSADRVSTYQAAMLAGLLRAPSRYNPLANSDLADRRTRQVLASMVDAGYISGAEAEAAIRYPGTVVALRGSRRGDRYFIDWVLEQVPAFVSVDDKDVVVTTTLDPRLQELAERRVASMLDGPGAERMVAQAALVAMTPDGAVRALVGGRDYGRSQFNRAVQARRQPGSAFKPFVFLAGLETGLQPQTRLFDGPIMVGNWRPENFGEQFRGETTLQEALALSINTVAVQVSEQAGRERVIQVARRLGLSANMKASPSVALGVDEVNLTELTAAYAAFATGGIGIWPYGIETIHDRGGRLLYKRGGTGPGRVLSREHAAQMTQMLVSAIERGTGRAAAVQRPAAGKTGTSQSYRDGWFIGYTADLIAGVWMGNDDEKPMQKVTGGSLPAQLWQGFMADAHQGLPPRSLPSLAPLVAPSPPVKAPELAAPGPSDSGYAGRSASDDRNLLERLIDAIAGDRN